MWFQTYHNEKRDFTRGEKFVRDQPHVVENKGNILLL